MSELSLKARDEYKFTEPDIEENEVLGIGIGEEDGCVVRKEDVAFLKEAYAERAYAVRLLQYFVRDQFPKNLPLVLMDFGIRRESILALLFAESFGLDRPWSRYVEYMRGMNNSFVPSDFEISSGSGIVDIDDDWTVELPDYGSTDVRESYLPVLQSPGTRITPESMFTANEAYRILQLELIHGLYRNLSLMHDICTAPGDYVAEPYNGGYQRAVRYWGGMTPTGYETSEYDLPYGGKGLYRSGYKGFDRTNDTTTVDTASEHPTLPFWKYEANIVMRADLGWKITSDGWSLGSVLSTYLKLEDNTQTTLYDFKRLHVFSDLITSSNVELCSDIKAYAVCGFEGFDTDEGQSEWGGSDYWNTRSDTQRCWTCKQLTLVKTGDLYNDCIVFDTDFDFGTVINQARSHFGYNGNWPAVVNPKTETIPTDVTYSPSDNIKGEHKVTRTVSFAWIKIVFRFKRDFRAKVLEA